jgi:hypothetical protein
MHKYEIKHEYIYLLYLSIYFLKAFLKKRTDNTFAKQWSTLNGKRNTEQRESYNKLGVNSDGPEGYAVPTPLMSPVSVQI